MSLFKKMQSRQIQKKANSFIKSLSNKSEKEIEQMYLDRKEFENHKYLLDFLNVWTSEHSTIKQAIFGGYVNGILLEEEYNFKPNTDFNEIMFPFI